MVRNGKQRSSGPWELRECGKSDQTRLKPSEKVRRMKNQI